MMSEASNASDIACYLSLWAITDVVFFHCILLSKVVRTPHDSWLIAVAVADRYINKDITAIL
jgi:hypothetical protein